MTLSSTRRVCDLTSHSSRPQTIGSVWVQHAPQSAADLTNNQTSMKVASTDAEFREIEISEKPTLRCAVIACTFTQQ